MELSETFETLFTAFLIACCFNSCNFLMNKYFLKLLVHDLTNMQRFIVSTLIWLRITNCMIWNKCYALPNIIFFVLQRILLLEFNWQWRAVSSLYTRIWHKATDTIHTDVFKHVYIHDIWYAFKRLCLVFVDKLTIIQVFKRVPTIKTDIGFIIA